MRDMLSIGTNRGYGMIGTGIGLGLAGFRINPAGILPVLDLDFANLKTLTARYGPTPSFSRASSGTYFDSTGVLQTATTNTPRFDHVYDGTNWVSKGLLIEEQRTNLLTYSNTFSNSAWTKVRGTVSQDITGPDGLTSGWTATCNSTGGGHYAYLTPGSGASTAGPYTVSVYVKKGNNGLVLLQMADTSFANSVFSFFNLDSQTAMTPTIIGSYSGAFAIITAVGNGWFRCSLTATKGTANGITASVYLSCDNATGTCTSGQYNYFYNAQLEFGSFATSAIVTTSSSVTRSADICQITGTDFSSFWNGTEGTLVAEWDATRNSSGQFTVYWVRDSSDSNTVLHTGREALSPPGVRFSVVSGGSVSAEMINAGFPSPGVTVKTAGCYKANDFAYSYNGAAALTDTTGAVPVSPTEMRIGYDPYGSWLSGHIARLRYYNTRLDNGTLRVLST